MIRALIDSGIAGLPVWAEMEEGVFHRLADHADFAMLREQA